MKDEHVMKARVLVGGPEADVLYSVAIYFYRIDAPSIPVEVIAVEWRADPERGHLYNFVQAGGRALALMATYSQCILPFLLMDGYSLPVADFVHGLRISDIEVDDDVDLSEVAAETCISCGHDYWPGACRGHRCNWCIT